MGIKTSLIGFVSRPEIVWNGSPGTPFTNGQTASFLPHNCVVMVSVTTGETVTVQLPDITLRTAGQTISIRNICDKKNSVPGEIRITPGESDSIEHFGTSASVRAVNPMNTSGDVPVLDLLLPVSMTFESTGTGLWTYSQVGGGFYNLQV